LRVVGLIRAFLVRFRFDRILVFVFSRTPIYAVHCTAHL
jgi:hypothetical protein